jgi:hypothetical protein
MSDTKTITVNLHNELRMSVEGRAAVLGLTLEEFIVYALLRYVDDQDLL